MTDNNTIFKASEAQRAFARDWHGGQASMLYAVASTGALSLGTIRPRWSDGEAFTDTEWRFDLAYDLLGELNKCQPEANEIEMFTRWQERMIDLVNELELQLELEVDASDWVDA